MARKLTRISAKEISNLLVNGFVKRNSTILFATIEATADKYDMNFDNELSRLLINFIKKYNPEYNKYIPVFSEYIDEIIDTLREENP